MTDPSACMTGCANTDCTLSPATTNGTPSGCLSFCNDTKQTIWNLYYPYYPFKFKLKLLINDLCGLINR